MLAFQQSQRSA